MGAMLLVGCSASGEEDVDTNEDISKEQRKGFSIELQEDAIEITDTIRDLYIEQELTYEELDIDSEEYSVLNAFDHEGYKNKDEEYSNQERSVINTVSLLITNYMLHETETEEGTTRVRGDDMMEKIHCIEKNVNEEGFLPC